MHSAGNSGKAGLRGNQGNNETRRGGGASLVLAPQQYAAQHLTVTSPQGAWNNEPNISTAIA
jgi:hypothetical protein